MSKQDAEFVFDQVMKLAGGADKYSDSTKGAIWAECTRNKSLQNLGAMYLVGSSERADKNLKALRAKIYEIFLDRSN